MKVTGKTTRWMATANFTMKEENWPMKDSGLRISSMAEEKSITIILSPWWALSITAILTIFRTIGIITLENSQRTVSRVEGESNFRMVRSLKAISSKIRFRELANFILLMER